MSAAEQYEVVSVADYLAAEEEAQMRHEYVGGVVHAMAGETRAHNEIAQNIAFAIRQRLKGGPCKLYFEDVKLHLTPASGDIFYYPDLMVTCDPRDTHPLWVEHPKLIIEVLSPSTESVDRREKLFAYRFIDTLEEYVLVEQDKARVRVHRRADPLWTCETFEGVEAAAVFRSIELTCPLREIYEGVL